jgi:hypothetical protein
MKGSLQNVRDLKKSERAFHRRWEESQRRKAEKLAKEQHETDAKSSGDRTA